MFLIPFFFPSSSFSSSSPSFVRKKISFEEGRFTHKRRRSAISEAREREEHLTSSSLNFYGRCIARSRSEVADKTIARPSHRSRVFLRASLQRGWDEYPSKENFLYKGKRG